MIPPLYWREAGHVDLLDQTALPETELWIQVSTPEEMADAIRRLKVRGAPAIGIAAAYGVVLALSSSPADRSEAVRRLHEAIDLLAATRPTAVNLFYALDRMRGVVNNWKDEDPSHLRRLLLTEANAIFSEDQDAGRRLADHGLSLLQDGMTLLTHCHTGGVATSGYGTALAPLIVAAERGLTLRAYVDETRPLLQGSRITAWELMKAGVEATLITDSMAGHVMHRGLVDAVIVGADRIAANGDVANKIGTYGLAVLARAHGIPFYVSAPISTVDLETESGADIEIEERDPAEITFAFGRQTAPPGVPVYNPAFDVTPAELIAAIITEHGVLRPSYRESLSAHAEKAYQ
ncbi:MAG: S-methyl-5-thioribose-1-phosphate isomerase [Bacteroidota bacterium]